MRPIMHDAQTENLQAAKAVVRAYIDAFDAAAPDQLTATLAAHTSDDYRWRGVHPFNEQMGAEAVVDNFWGPLKSSFTPMQRRMDFFFAGTNVAGENNAEKTPKDQDIWVVNAGNFLGLFDADWLGIPHTRKIALLRYAEFHRVADGKIAETAFFCDILSVMHQAGAWPKALAKPMTGAPFIYPGAAHP